MSLAGGGAGCVLPDYIEADGECQQGTPWTRQIGGGLADIALAAAPDPCGGVTIGGGIQSTVAFSSEISLVADNKDLDGFVARFDAVGNTLWAASIGSSGQQIVSHVGTDIVGDTVAAGSFVGTLSPGGGESFKGEGDPSAPVPSSPTGGNKDGREYSGFITKLDLFGAHAWTRVFLGPTDMTSTTPCGVAVDREGNVTVAGNFTGSVTIEGSTLTGQGESSIFMAHFDAAGGLLWKKAFATEKGTECNALAADKDGNILMTGMHRSAIDFGIGPLAGPTIEGGQKYFVLKMDPAGNLAWSAGSATGDGHGGTAIASDAEGNVFVGGSFLGMINLGAGDFSSKAVDLFVQKRNSAGEPQWGRVFSPAMTGLVVALVTAIQTDASGDVLLGGSIFGDLVLDQHLVAQMEDIPSNDAYIARLRGSNGEPVASRLLNGPGDLAITGLAVDAEGLPIVVSAFTKSIDLGPGAGLLEADDVGLGTMFVSKLKL